MGIQLGPGVEGESLPATSESVSEEPNSSSPNVEKSAPSRNGLKVVWGIGVAVLVVAYLVAFGASYYGLIGYNPDEIPAANPSPEGNGGE